MSVDRLMPSQEAEDLIALTRDIADKVLDPVVDAHEKAETYPEGVFGALGAAGLLSLPQPEEWGGGGQPFEVYLQVLRGDRGAIGRRSLLRSACTACRRIRC